MRAEFARMFDSVLWVLAKFVLLTVVVSAICAAVLYFFVAGGLREQRAARAREQLPIVSLHEINNTRPSAPGDNADELQRQAQLKAQAEAIELRPQVKATSVVDDETRKRIAAAVKRLEAPPADVQREGGGS